MAPNPALEMSRAQGAAPCGEADGALHTVSACSGTFLHKQTPRSVVTAFLGKFLPKCCLRSERNSCFVAGFGHSRSTLPPLFSTLLSFLTLTETFWVHSLYVWINLL